MTIHPQTYKSIAAWGKMLSSMNYYIEQQQIKASKDNAPIDAIYYSQDEKRWICVSDLSADHDFNQKYREATK